jgi:alginate O-acetyltransferase complex protein AlgI
MVDRKGSSHRGNYRMKTNATKPGLYLAMTALVMGPILAWWFSRAQPAWVMMWVISGAEFAGLKLLTLLVANPTASLGRKLGYLALWPGMDARGFFRERPAAESAPGAAELIWAVAKAAAGMGAVVWAASHVVSASPMSVAWTGMLGIVFVLHFGVFHALSWGWRRIGVNAPPIMRAPIAAKSLAELWGGRWNVAFTDAAKLLLMRALAPRWGAGWAGAAVFLVSGLVHETVISLPARGGWGGPTLYFLIQAGGLAVERSRVGRRCGCGAGFAGWLWMALCALVPLPLLFNPPFVHRVIIPQFEFLHQFLP